MKVVEYYYDSEIGDTVCVAFMDMDPMIKGQAVYSVPDDRFTIYINTIHSIETQQKAFQHERNHILNGDFQKEDVQQIELAAHGIADPEEDEQKNARIEEAYQRMMRSLDRKRKKLIREMEKERRYIEERNKLLEQIGRELAYEEREDEFGRPVRVLVERRI